MLKKSYVNLRAEWSLNYDLYHILKKIKTLIMSFLRYFQRFYLCSYVTFITNKRLQKFNFYPYYFTAICQLIDKVKLEPLK